MAADDLQPEAPEDQTAGGTKELNKIFAPPSTSNNISARPKSSFATGTGVGGAVALFAQSLREPFKTWVVLAAPGVASTLTLLWPRILAYGESWLRECLLDQERRSILRALRKYVKTQRKRLETETLPEDQAAEIRQNIEKAEKAIIDRDFDVIKKYIQ